jgi:hypothetical protein
MADEIRETAPPATPKKSGKLPKSNKTRLPRKKKKEQQKAERRTAGG